MAITLYESYVFRVGNLAALSIATLLIYFISDATLVWTYSGLFVGGAYAIAAFSSFRRFKPDIMTSFNNHAPGFSR